MSEITAAKVKELREKTGVGMMDAKKALVESNGDMEAAIDALRAKGLAKAAKKSGRTAAEGLVTVAISDDAKKAVILEINAETDFVARNEKFQGAVHDIAKAALAANISDIEALAKLEIDGKAVQDILTELIATIGENMQLRRIELVEAQDGVIARYIHGAVATDMGRIGVLVALKSTIDAGQAQEIGKKIAMHVAAAKPEYLVPEQVDADRLEREKAVLREQAADSGKPPEIIEKMLDGRIRKFYEEICLLNQTYVIDGESKVGKFVESAGKDAGGELSIQSYSSFILGEGIEKEEANFAEEVKNAVNG